METAFFWLSKVVWNAIAPETLLLLAVLATWILLARGAVKWARRLLAAISACLLFLAFLPVGEWVLYPLEARFPVNPPLPDRVDGIIVLGGAEDPEQSTAWGQIEFNGSAERFTVSVALARRYPQAKVLFTSGSGSILAQEHKGAAVARQFYEQQGISESRLIFEGQSRNTRENVAMSKAMVQPSRGEVWVLVTSAFHMPRSAGLFCKAAWPVIAYPVDHRTLRGRLLRVGGGILGNMGNLTVGIKEWVGLVVYYATGRTSALFPGSCDA